MKKVTIYVDDKYANVMTMTFVGVNINGFQSETNVTTYCVDLQKNRVFEIDENGKGYAIKDD